jgi:hypothetical protein
LGAPSPKLLSSTLTKRQRASWIPRGKTESLDYFFLWTPSDGVGE